MTPLEAMHCALRDPEAMKLDGADIGEYIAKARGIVHVGANIGQERDLYAALDLPVIWIEPLAIAFNVLTEAIAAYPKQQALQYLCTDRDGDLHKFGVANNGCQSSSIFDIAKHKDLWPEVGFIEVVSIESTRLDTIFERHGIDLDVYDTLILDVQGAELLVLKGAGRYINRFRRIIAEAADFDSYHGGCQLADLDGYLLPLGYVIEEHVPITTEPGIGTYFEAVYQNSLAPQIPPGDNRID